MAIKWLGRSPAAPIGVLIVVVVGLALAYWYVDSTRLRRARRHLTQERASYAPAEIIELGRLPAEVSESSGLGISRSYPGAFWTHNDSGDAPRFYALDESAGLLATIDVQGVEARDWEAMALGPCPHHSVRSCLYAGDIGDNLSLRDSVVVHVIEEPDPFAGDSTVSAIGSVRFVYPDGPHDAEGLAITGAGDLVVVTKERKQTTWLFQIPARDVSAAIEDARVVTLGAGTQLPIHPDRAAVRYATGAALNARGDYLAVRTYAEIYVFPWPLAADPRPIDEACWIDNSDPQGEAIAFRDDGWMVLTSETRAKRPGLLRAVRCFE
tara:strand:+ start:42 stop:1013 length:972 start_codon:yes stop_codon:yes gene_type:complete